MPRLRPARRRNTSRPGDSRSPALALLSSSRARGCCRGRRHARQPGLPRRSGPRQRLGSGWRLRRRAMPREPWSPSRPGRAGPSRSCATTGWPPSLVVAGLVLRVITWMAYHPALLYIDSVKYLYRGWQGSDPLGYKVPLKIVLAVGNLGTVTALQHLLGLGMGVALYVLLMRRGVNRWLAALAIAPVLLDGYQLQAEATIMPDVLFEGMVVAGLCILLWKPTTDLADHPRLRPHPGPECHGPRGWPVDDRPGRALPARLTVSARHPRRLVQRRAQVVRDVPGVPAAGCPVLRHLLLRLRALPAVGQGQRGRAHGTGSRLRHAEGRRLPYERSARLRITRRYSPDWLEHAQPSPLLLNAPKIGRAPADSVFDHAVEKPAAAAGRRLGAERLHPALRGGAGMPQSRSRRSSAGSSSTRSPATRRSS